MSSHVFTITKGVNEKNRIKIKIRVGSVVKEKVRETEENIREGISRRMRMRKEVVGCVQAVVGKNIFLVQFVDGQKKEMSYSLLVFLCSKEEVEMDEPLSHFPEK